MSKQRQTREKNLRADIIEGSVWVPFLSTDRFAPFVTVLVTPGPGDTEILVRSYAGRRYSTRIATLLAQYRRARDEGHVEQPPSRPSEAVEPIGPASIPCALRKLAPVAVVPEVVAAPAEPIAPMPENLGVRVYMLRGAPVVIAAAVGRALGYADDGKKLIDVIRQDWSAEMIEHKHFLVLTGSLLREFKQIVGDTQERWVSSSARLMVLFEAGWDLVCIKTEKPEGPRLRARLADEVLPKLRRGERVAPVAAPLPAAASTDAKIDKLLDAVAGLTAALAASLAKPPPALPVAPAPAAPVERLVPRSWHSAEMIKALLGERHHCRISQKDVDTAIRDLRIRERPDAAVCRMVPRESSGVPYQVPSWRYAPSVVEEIDRSLFPPPAQQPLPGADTTN